MQLYGSRKLSVISSRRNILPPVVFFGVFLCLVILNDFAKLVKYGRKGVIWCFFFWLSRNGIIERGGFRDEWYLIG